MTLPELEPTEVRLPDVVKTFEQFEKKVNSYSKILSDVSDVEQYVNKFLKVHPEFEKQLRTQQLAAKEIKFELTPLIAQFSASLKSMSHEITLVEELNHVALRPIDGVEGEYYHRDLYIPIPKDMLNLDSEKKLLKEHFDLIDCCIDKELIQNILELKPLGIVTRVCGWDGSWIVYSYTTKDGPSVIWSAPLVNSPYKTQPFLALKGGEFVILEDDLHPERHSTVEDIKKRIEKRIKGIEGLELRPQKAITVDMEWVIAHAINTDAIFRGFPLEFAVRDLGEHIPDLTIHKETLKAEDLLQFMRKDITSEPTYRFKLENIQKFTIPRK